MPGSARTVIRDAAVSAAICSLVGLVFNAVRPAGIPLVADAEYERFVPCPEPLGEVEWIEPSDPRVMDPRALRIDARSAQDFHGWHLPDAQNIPFDYLDGVADATVRRVASLGAVRVVVYRDGEDPNSGREMARELAGRGVRNVFFVVGGAPALMSMAARDAGGRP